ncbi:MAG: type II toxin-antitoxin system PemK/MazF family toxin [Prevotellaceae bacterium]|jgi:mRNA interferase MazF|nr:type II toxin-antitoxin system PemK/MazF family toxin [Prevotellaceae bacterium]
MKQGEIWLVDLNPTIGAEMQKVRPALIVNVDALGKLPLKVIVPVTDWKEQYVAALWMQKIVPNKENGLEKKSAIDCFQIRCVAQERLVRKIGIISFNELEEIKSKIAIIVGYK